MKYRWYLSIIFLLLIPLLTACGGSSTTSGAQSVQVTLSDFKIASSSTAFSAGVPYHFVVTNNGKTAHELVIVPMNMSMGGMSMDDMHKMALALIDNVNPGETKTLDFTFQQSAAGQEMEFACHLAGHYEAGMKLPVMVDK